MRCEFTLEYWVEDGWFLVAEVADTTARYDRQVNLPFYARHAIPEVWRVVVEASVLHTFSTWPAARRA